MNLSAPIEVPVVDTSTEAWLLRVLRISVCHLAPATWQRIVRNDNLGHAFENWGDASWVCPVQAEDEVLAADAPDDLKQALALGRRYGVQYVKFEPLGPVARRLPAFYFAAGTINYPRDGRRELAVRFGRAAAVLELPVAHEDTWLELLSLDGTDRVQRRSHVPASFGHRQPPEHLLAVLIEIARMLDADEHAALSLHEDAAAQAAIGRGDLVLAMQLLQAATVVRTPDFRARVSTYYGSVQYTL